MRGPDSIARNRARGLRRASTDAESALWRELRGRRFAGHKFVRQAPIDIYFADFLCREAKLVIELDGSQHDGSIYDEKRDRWIAAQGYTILRFWNAGVLRNRRVVLDTIAAAIEGSLPLQRAADLKVKAART